jgi:hypothetical protein
MLPRQQKRRPIEAAFKSITLLWNGRALSAAPPDYASKL